MIMDWTVTLVVMTSGDPDVEAEVERGLITSPQTDSRREAASGFTQRVSESGALYVTAF